MGPRGLREGDYIETSEHLIFSVKGLFHLKERIIAYLRYIPDPEAERKRSDGLKFRRIYDLRESTEYLRRNFDKYLYFSEKHGVLLQAVPKDEIMKVYRPAEWLKEIGKGLKSELEEMALKFAKAIACEVEFPLRSIGVSGSLLLGLATASSDVDLVIYGEKNCRQAYEAIKRLRNREDWISPYDARRVMRVIQARWGEIGIDPNVLAHIETSKVLHGLVEGRDYFIRLVKDWGDIKEEQLSYRPLGTAVIHGRIKDDSDSIFTPCSYLIDECRFLEQPGQGMVEELVSFRGRFTEQVRAGELFEARGKLENVLTKQGAHLRILLGDPGDYLIPIALGRQMFREEEEVRILLDSLGLQPGEIVETILTTWGPGGELNAAPMGVLRVGPRDLEVRPYLDTRTYQNLRDIGRAVVNITHDVELFLESALERGEARANWFGEYSRAMPPSLKGADALLSVSVLGEERLSERRARLLCRVDWGRVQTPFPRAFSRGFAASLEAIIHATRIEAFIREGKWEEVNGLLQRFKVCGEIVDRVSPEDSPNRRVLRSLEVMIKEWMSGEQRYL